MVRLRILRAGRLLGQEDYIFILPFNIMEDLLCVRHYMRHRVGVLYLKK